MPEVNLHLLLVILVEIITSQDTAIHQAKVLQELVIVALCLPLLTGDDDDPLPFNLYIWSQNLQSSSQDPLHEHLDGEGLHVEHHIHLALLSTDTALGVGGLQRLGNEDHLL